MPIFEIPDPRTWTRIFFQCVHKQRETSAVVKNAQSYRPTSEDLVPEPKDEREKVEPRSSPVFHRKPIVLKVMILAASGDDGYSIMSWLWDIIHSSDTWLIFTSTLYFTMQNTCYQKWILSAIKILHKLSTTMYPRWGKLSVIRNMGTSTISSYSVLMPLKCSSFVFVFIYCIVHRNTLNNTHLRKQQIRLVTSNQYVITLR